jgi:hypothetical protein
MRSFHRCTAIVRGVIFSSSASVGSRIQCRILPDDRRVGPPEPPPAFPGPGDARPR